MNNTIITLGELEKEIIDLIWNQKHRVTVKFVFEALVQKRKIAYTTVMTVMGRLVAKGLLKVKVSGKAYTYQAAVSKDKFLAKTSRQIIKNFVSNFGDAAVAHFAQEIEKIPEDKRQKLLKMLKDSK